MNQNELCDFLKENGAIIQGDFIGKSGLRYTIETDIRTAFITHNKAMQTARVLLDYIKCYFDEIIPFIGVPETGTLLSFYLNEALYEMNECDYTPNMLRSVPKEYQQSTNSVYTVLPVDNEQKYILIEDDVVTGNTLCKYLKTSLAAGLNIVGVVAVFGRDSAFAVDELCTEFKIPYIELVNVKCIEGD